MFKIFWKRALNVNVLLLNSRFCIAGTFRCNVSMKELIQSLVSWHRNGYLDPDVWEQFLRHQLDPALMPAPSELQLQADGQIQKDNTVSIIFILFLTVSYSVYSWTWDHNALIEEEGFLPVYPSDCYTYSRINRKKQKRQQTPYIVELPDEPDVVPVAIRKRKREDEKVRILLVFNESKKYMCIS